MGNKGNEEASSFFGTIGTHLGNTAGMFDKAAELKEVAGTPRSTTPGILSAFGNMLAGAGKVAGGQYTQGGLEVGGSFFDMAALGGNKAFGAAGAAARGASAGYTMYENWDQCSADAAWTDNKCFTAAGDMAFAGAEVAAPVLGTALKFGLDAAGTVAGWIDEDWAFSSGSAAGAAIHGGAVAGKAVSDTAESAWNWVTGYDPTPKGVSIGSPEYTPRLDRQGVNPTCAGLTNPTPPTTVPTTTLPPVTERGSPFEFLQPKDEDTSPLSRRDPFEFLQPK
jgi:hypothetical protein